MNTSHRFLIAACALACAGAASQAGAWPWGGSEAVQGNGNVQRETRPLGHFNALALSLPGKVEVRSGGKEGVTIEVDGNLLPYIETVIEDGTLKIRSKARDKWNPNLRFRTLRIVVQASELERLTLDGSGDIDADLLRGKQVGLKVAGSGNMKVHKVEGDTVSATVSGSGDVDVEGGAAHNLSVSISGAGDVDMAHLRSEVAKVAIAGSGDVEVWARANLNISIAGSGDVDYYGDPQISKSVAGSGDIRRKGTAPD